MARYEQDALDYPPRRSVIPLLFFLALIGFLVWYLWPRSERITDPNAAPRPVTARGDLAEDEKSTIALYKEASPSVVHITSVDLRRDALSLNVLKIPRGTGTGFIWDKDGHIVTNYHVIKDADAAYVTLADRTTVKAKTVGADPDHDLAVLYINPTGLNLRPIPIGSSADLQVGQKVFAIGNPFGLDQTLTTGVVSGLGREVETGDGRPLQGLIQTDASINPGNSGGPLLDSAGRLIGVNTAILSPSGASAGIGFAIPVDDVNRIVPEIIRYGKVIRPGMGIQIASDQVSQQYGLDGVLVFSVMPDSPAEKAGIRPTRRTQTGEIVLGDIIMEIDGKRIRTTSDLFQVLGNHRVGDTIQVTVRRGTETVTLPVTLEGQTQE